MIDFVIRTVDKLSETVGKLAMAFALLLVLVVMADVAMRYFLNISYSALREMEWHLYSALFLLGGAYTLRRDAHVRVDVLYQRFSVKGQAFINVLGTLVMLFPGCWLIMETSMPFVAFSWNMHEISPDPGGLPYRWLLKALIPIGFGLMSLQGVSFLLKNILVLMGKRVPELDEEVI